MCICIVGTCECLLVGMPLCLSVRVYANARVCVWYECVYDCLCLLVSLERELL